jgi:excisionase family DNA binding protein
MAEPVNMTVTFRYGIRPSVPPRLWDVTEAGRYLGVSHKVIRQLVQAGELPYIQRVQGRSPYLLDIRDLDKWIEINKSRAF